MLTEKLWIFMRIYKQFDPSFSLICYYSFIFGLLLISIGLSVFGFVANEYKWRAIRLLSAICNIRSVIQWAIPKVILNYSRLSNRWGLNFGISPKIRNHPLRTVKLIKLSVIKLSAVMVNVMVPSSNRVSIYRKWLRQWPADSTKPDFWTSGRRSSSWSTGPRRKCSDETRWEAQPDQGQML